MEDAKFQKGNYTGEVMGLNPMAGAQGFANEGYIVINKGVRREKKALLVECFEDEDHPQQLPGVFDVDDHDQRSK